MISKLALVAVAALGATVIAGCAAEPEEQSTGQSSSASTASTTSPGSSSQSAPPATSPAAASSSADAAVSPGAGEAPFPADASPDSAQPSTDAALVLTAVRAGTHEGYDRVVLEFAGTGTPGWQAQYAAEASRQGPGDPITPGGSAILDISVTGSAIPEAGQATVPAGQITPSGTSVIKGVFNDGTFEGITHVVLGVDGQQPFRVFALSGPPRVVIDVQK